MTSRMALKEWAVVVQAIGSGRQLLLLRKGGIRDPRGEFELEHREFLLYPTWEHQAPEHVRPECRTPMPPAPAPLDPVEFRVYAGVALTWELRDPAVVDSLQRYHVWTPEFVAQRMRYRPQAPTLLVVVRAYRLKRPARRDARPEDAGCKSWVPLAEPVDVEGAEPVLDNRRFRAALEEIYGKVAVLER